ncbi:MAG TPA: sigma-70 family RNA polymerase sigma factor [Solirubrobacteraceae bacterium]|nr:sigma-70 family RNA polymerase sigma factor [Solirubrobacteraceae bacterium]
MTAFEILYDRHVRELLSFCRYMLDSRADAEDAVQSTFASAHRALLTDDRAIDLRPWLFAIARNACLSILRGRRPVAEIAEAWPSREDPVVQVEQREDMRQVLATLQELPEVQRTALVLSELHGFSQSEIGTLLGVRPEQVKSYVYQARTNLISEREARGADCRVIREELILARGPALLKSRLRRHLRSCQDCREYAAEVASQRHHLGILLPVALLLALKRRALHALLESVSSSSACAGGVGGGPATSATLELGGGGAGALMVKVLVGVVCLGASTGAATLVVGIPDTAARSAASTPSGREVVRSRLASFVVARSGATPAAPHPAGAPLATTGGQDSQPQPAASPPRYAQASPGGPVVGSVASSTTGIAASESHGGGSGISGKSKELPGKSEAPHGASSEESHGKEGPVKGEEPHGKSEEARGKEEAHGKSEEARGGEEPHGNSEAAHGKSEEAHGREAAQGASEEARGTSEGTHGKEEPHGGAEERHGKSEEPHGNAKGE